MTNRITDILGIKKPIIQGPLAWLTNGQYAGAVSAAGGLGVLGISAGQTVAETTVEETIENMRREIRIAHIGYVLGVQFTPADIECPIAPEILDAVQVTPYSDPRLENVLKVAREGWTLREIVYHSVIDYHLTAVGNATDIADHMTAWFEAGVADGFWVMPDVYAVDLPRFVDEVVPILQERGIFHKDYEGETLREHLGVPYQYGVRD